jgi:hypothetical protein
MAAVTLTKDEGKATPSTRAQVVIPSTLPPELRALFNSIVVELNSIKSELAVLQAKIAKAQSV